MDTESFFYLYRGRVGLYVLLKALDIGPGDEVVTQAFTCVAVPEAIMATGAKPLFVDIETDGFNMCPKSLEKNLNAKVKAVVIQHTFGIPAQLGPLKQICKRRGIPIIEDCCHTLNSFCDGVKVGTFGVGTFYSYEWGKPIVGGIGGSVSINDKALFKQMKAALSCLTEPPISVDIRLNIQYYIFNLIYHPRLYWPVRSAYKFLGNLGIIEGNYSPIDCLNPSKDFKWKISPGARKRVELKSKHINNIDAWSIKISNRYRSEITKTSLHHPKVYEGSKTVFSRYPLRVIGKKNLLERARKENVELADWYAFPIHPLSLEESRKLNYYPGDCPNAEVRCDQIVSLPVNSRVNEAEASRIIQFLNQDS